MFYRICGKRVLSKSTFGKVLALHTSKLDLLTGPLDTVTLSEILPVYREKSDFCETQVWAKPTTKCIKEVILI